MIDRTCYSHHRPERGKRRCGECNHAFRWPWSLRLAHLRDMRSELRRRVLSCPHCDHDF